MEEIYASGIANFFRTYLVYALCLVGMLLGLSLGKRVLTPESFLSQKRNQVSSPRTVFLFSSVAACACLLTASFVCRAEAASAFWVYAVLAGFLNGMFSGVAYQAPMLACQLFFPDRKSFVGGLLLLGLALGVATYSLLTAYWASDCTSAFGCANLSAILQNLSYCLFGHSVLASALLCLPQQHLN